MVALPVRLQPGDTATEPFVPTHPQFVVNVYSGRVKVQVREAGSPDKWSDLNTFYGTSYVPSVLEAGVQVDVAVTIATDEYRLIALEPSSAKARE